MNILVHIVGSIRLRNVLMHESGWSRPQGVWTWVSVATPTTPGCTDSHWQYNKY